MRRTSAAAAIATATSRGARTRRRSGAATGAHRYHASRRGTRGPSLRGPPAPREPRRERWHGERVRVILRHLMVARVRIVGSPLSPYVRKVLVCLELKGITWEIDPIVPFMGD